MMNFIIGFMLAGFSFIEYFEGENTFEIQIMFLSLGILGIFSMLISIYRKVFLKLKSKEVGGSE